MRRVPTAVKTLAIIAVVFTAAVVYLVDRLGTQADNAVAAFEEAMPAGVPGTTVVQDVPALGQRVAVVGGTVAEFTPRLAGRPESAPIYDPVRVVKAMPVVLGCVSMRARCSCITEQGTDAGLTDDQCRAWLDNPPFNPYREAPAAAAAAVQPVKAEQVQVVPQS